ncbi:peptide-methionine (R)-S-oxide reductase MsrB [Candidatus Saccharibacteria bacterium]|nr:peptide-methionine (R)-S-oxide reductase MsrB [Candidatus Saccharibacteria bacterium]
MTEDWRTRLTPQQYAVLREKATEAPFSGEYDLHFKDGTYACAGCGQELFGSETKFNAHCGWPSFFDAKPHAVEFITDDSHGMTRTEVVCGNCSGHLGHVFEGEGFATPTDQRYCINSLSLAFSPTKGEDA